MSWVALVIIGLILLVLSHVMGGPAPVPRVLRWVGGALVILGVFLVLLHLFGFTTVYLG